MARRWDGNGSGTVARGVSAPARASFLALASLHLPASLLLLALCLAARGHATAASHSPRNGATTMPDPRSVPLLDDYYETFLRDKDIEAFRVNILSRYNEATLIKVLEQGDVRSRRAAVLALGLVGSFSVNEQVARGLRDADPVVRSLTDNALWAIWYRADTPENNATLERVRAMIGSAGLEGALDEKARERRLEQAIELANRLIERSPNFAEAYNQRAIAHFALRQFESSAADCRRVLERNPCHIGALGGLGQCYLHLERPHDALQTFRRALKIQPYNDSLREFVTQLEAAES